MNRLIGAGVVALALAGCGSSTSTSTHARISTTAPSAALPDYTAAVQTLVKSKAQSRLAATLKGANGPADARLLSDTSACMQTAGTENYTCQFLYTILAAAEGFDEEYQADIDVTCFEANNCTITSVGAPTQVGGTQ